MKNLLIISRDFPPSAIIAAMRAFRLVRRISGFGWRPFVLTAPDACQIPIDSSLAGAVPPTVHVEAVRCHSPWRHTAQWRDVRGLRRAVAYMAKSMTKIAEPLCRIDFDSPWIRPATRAGISLVKRQRIDLLWATSPPLSNLVVARRISQACHIPYVVDYRDVIRALELTTLPPRQRKNVVIERDVLWDCAGMTHVTPRQETILAERYPCIMRKPRCLVYNWFEASDIASCTPKHFAEPTIFHGGTLYGGMRRLDGFFAALALLKRSPPAGGAPPRFVQRRVGHDDAVYLAPLAAKHGVAEMIDLGPGLPRREFLSACRGADILLLVIGYNTGVSEHADAIPGKLFDYLPAGRPILVVGPEATEAGRIVTRLNRGIAVPDDAPERIAQAIRRLLRSEGESGPLDLRPEAVSEFEASHVVKQLARFLDSIVDAVSHR